MRFLQNLMLLFGIYLPATLLVGLPGGFYLSADQEPNLRYAVFLWFVIAVQLLIPTLFAVGAIQLLMRWTHGLPPRLRRAGCMLLVAAGFALAHASVWGRVALSWPLVCVELLPALLYGALFRLGPKTGDPGHAAAASLTAKA